MLIREFIEPYPMITKFLLNGISVISEYENIPTNKLIINILLLIMSETGIKLYYEASMIS
jgi:hypothetical protein